jgi:hypothetical protein
MTANQSTKGLMNAGLGLAAAIIVIRIALEQFGAPGIVNNVFGVAWLYFIMPALFAVRIVGSGNPRPVRGLFMDLLLFGVYTRLMVLVTYLAAYYFRWQAPRFGQSQGGNVGEGISPLQGLLVIPLRNAAVWIVFVVIIGMIIGGITLKLRKRPQPAA